MRDAKATSAGSTSGGGTSLGSLRQPSLLVRSRLLIALALATTALFAFTAPAASAHSTHAFSTSFGQGQLNLIQPTFSHAGSGLALDDTAGHLYVADTGNHRVVEFDTSGNVIRAFGANVGGAGVNVCTTGCVAGTPGSGPGAFTDPVYVAVDNSAGPSAGDVYVGDAGTGLIQKFDPNGNLITAWGSGGQLDGTSADGFTFTAHGSIAGVAVDSGGVLGVILGDSTVERFAQDSTFSTSFVDARGTSLVALSVDSAGNFFKVNGDSSVEKIQPDGAEVGQVTASNASSGLAADTSNDDLYVATGVGGGGGIEHYAFPACDPTVTPCSPADSFGAGELSFAAGLAVDPADHTVYVADTGNQRIAKYTGPVTLADVTTGAASAITTTAATIDGTVNPDSVTVTGCSFDYVDDADYVAAAANPYASGATVPCAEAVGSGSSDVLVHADLTGLTPGTTYHFRLRAANANAESRGADQTFQTAGPTVKDEWSAVVGQTDATLHALINPNGSDTTYHFEYGTDTSYGTSAPDADLGSGSADVAVSGPITGLAPATTYHFRVLATNSTGTTPGPDRAFTTRPTPPSGPDTCPNAALRSGYGIYLPDCRAYEQVSPTDKNSTDAALVTQGVPQDLSRAALSGDGLVFTTFGNAFAGEPGGQSTDYYLSRRGPAGWTTDGINPPLFVTPSLIDDPYNHLAFTDELGAGSPVNPSPATPDATPGQSNLYRSDLSDPGHPSYQLITPAFPNAIPFSVENANDFPSLSGASADLSHLIFTLPDTLTPDAPLVQIDTGPIGGVQYGPNLYEWASGQLRLVNVAPDGSPIPSETTNCGDTASTRGNCFSRSPRNISADGSRIFFQGADGKLYVRENGTTTVQIDASQSSGPGGGGSFLSASTDGSKVLFVDDDAAGLTPDTVSNSGRNLYLFDVGAHTLTDLTPAPAAQLDGLVGTADDASYVYFVADGALAPGATPGNCRSGDPLASCNLYLWHAGAITFITSLRGGDSADWLQNDQDTSGSAYGPVTVTPDGTHLALESTKSLTGYDNLDANTGERDSEIYLYDSAADQFRCASCNPTGARPQGPSHFSTQNYVSAGPLLHTPRSLSADGSRLFFNSVDSLTERDTNSVHSCPPSGGIFNATFACQDVYQWEADGSGSCQSSAQNGGCLDLISTGASANSALFLDASADGRDVFFITRDRLAGQDADGLYDVYDARVGGGLPSQNQASLPPCGSPEQCHLAGTAASPQTSAGTASFQGAGNPPLHRKAKKHHKKKHHKRHAKRHHRRGGASKQSRSDSSAQRARPKHLYRASTNRGGSK